MTINWHKSESMTEPEEVLFAKTTVFIRKNVHTEEREYEEEKETIYVYDEAILTKAEYAQYLSERNKADIDYICMEVGVEL